MIQTVTPFYLASVAACLLVSFLSGGVPERTSGFDFNEILDFWLKFFYGKLVM